MVVNILLPFLIVITTICHDTFLIHNTLLHYFPPKRLWDKADDGVFVWISTDLICIHNN